ncbi:MAG: DNA topoisomerase [Candidatus Bathyarchaeia archaeon]
MLVIAEKPSVARTIKLSIKPPPPVVALKGHVLELDFPARYSNWRRVDPRELFKAPTEWVIKDNETYKILKDSLKESEMLILATDNDPEGELIAYEALLIAKEVLGDTPKYGRMRFNAATQNELRRAWENLEQDLRWSWVWKALLRHKFDLVTGAAYTRLLTLSKRLNNGSSLISWGSCVKGDTIIPGDYKPISEVKVGDSCIGWNSCDSRVIKKFVRMYSGQLVKVKAAGLLPLELTPEHPVLVSEDIKKPDVGFPRFLWKSAKYLMPKSKGKFGDYLVIPRIKGITDATEISLKEFGNENESTPLILPLNEETSWLLGRYVANGRLLDDQLYIPISRHDLETLNRITNIIRNIGASLFFKEKQKTLIACIYSRLLCKALAAWCGDKAEHKRIPEFILLHKDPNLVRAFLDGYFKDTLCKRQYSNKQIISAKTRSKVLAIQIQLLCFKLGYPLYIYVNNNRFHSTVYSMRLKFNPGDSSFRTFSEYVLTPIRCVEYIPYSGLVYNLETSDNTYLVSNAVVHNCQIPTLWFVYKREMEIRDFKPEKYYVISALIDAFGVKVKVTSEPIKDSLKAQHAYTLAKSAKYALVRDFQLKDDIEHKPLPTDTDVMLQELSKITGLSAAKIMALAESLYGDGYISYPRTQTNMWLTVDHKSILSMLSSTLLGKYINMFYFSPKDGKKNDGAHPPIYPTGYYSGHDIKGKVWEYIARRYLANVVGKDAILKKWKLNVDLGGVQMNASSKYFTDEGFHQIFPYFKPKDTLWIPQLQINSKLPVIKVDLEERETKPPARLTESELLRHLERYSIGTDATRADYPHIIIERGYAEKRKKSFYITGLGEALINLLKNVDERLVTPDTRRYVERLMTNVEEGKINLDSALNEALKIYEQLFERVSIKLKTGVW